MKIHLVSLTNPQLTVGVIRNILRLLEINHTEWGNVLKGQALPYWKVAHFADGFQIIYQSADRK